MDNKTGNTIVDLSFEFALKVISFSEELERNNKYVLARQILRSGTSIGANIREAQHCESKSDFIHKIKIAAKEAEETKYWLLLCQYSANYPFDEGMIDDLTSIQKVMSKIISTSKKQY